MIFSTSASMSPAPYIFSAHPSIQLIDSESAIVQELINLIQVLGLLGVGADSHTVISGDLGGLSASRLYWELEGLGHQASPCWMCARSKNTPAIHVNLVPDISPLHKELPLRTGMKP